MYGCWGGGGGGGAEGMSSDVIVHDVTHPIKRLGKRQRLLNSLKGCHGLQITGHFIKYNLPFHGRHFMI